MKKTFLPILFLFCALQVLAQSSGIIDPNFRQMEQSSVFVGKKYAYYDDHKILVAGQLAGTDGQQNSVGIARLNEDGTFDLSFKQNFTGDVYQMEIVNGNQALIASSNGFFRLNYDGSLDNSFVPAVDSIVEAFSLYRDKRILIFERNGVYGVKTSKRLFPNGSLDSGFPVTDQFRYPAMVLGDTLYCGYYTNSNSRFSRVFVDGTRDSTFKPDDFGTVKLFKLTDGSLLRIYYDYLFKEKVLIHYSANGARDTIFTNLYAETGEWLDVDAGPDSSFYARTQGVSRYNCHGVKDSSFSTYYNWANIGYQGLSVDLKGRVNFCGNTTRRVLANGGIDSVYATKQTDQFRIIVDKQDRILTFSNSTLPNSYDKIVGRLTKDGQKDFSFSPVSLYNATFPTISDDGSFVLSYFDTSLHRLNWARYDEMGKRDTTFKFVPTKNVDIVQALSSGKYQIAYRTNDLKYYLERINHDGSPDPSFVPKKMRGAIGEIVEISNGVVVVMVQEFATSTKQTIEMYKPDGTGTIYSMIFHLPLENPRQQKNGKLVVRTIDHFSPDRSLVRFNLNGSLDTTFKIFPGAYSAPLILSDDAIIVATADKIYRLRKDGSIDENFVIGNVNPDANSVVYGQSNGSIIVKGNFYTYNDEVRNGLVRLVNVLGSSIEEDSRTVNSLEVFPNPTSDILYIDKIKTGLVKVEIYNMNGQLIQKDNLFKTEESLKVEVKDLHSGSYVIRLIGDDEVHTAKFSKF